MKALVGAFNQEKALVGAFSVIVKTGCGTDGSICGTNVEAAPEINGIVGPELAAAAGAGVNLVRNMKQKM